MPNPAARLLRNARRELVYVLAVWLIALVWTVGVSYWLGYDRPPDQMRLILGFPEWAFYGVFLPWMFSTAATVYFCLRFMTDDDLGREREDAGESA